MARKQKQVAATEVPQVTVEATVEVSKSALQRTLNRLKDSPLFKTKEGERIKRQPGSRRTKLYLLIQDGMTVQQVIDAGGHPGDLYNLLKWRNVMTTPECDTSGAENGRYARAFPVAVAAPAPVKAKKVKAGK
jgi:hypothetical protein